MAQLNRGQLPGFAEGGLVGEEKAGSEDEESKAKKHTNNVNIVSVKNETLKLQRSQRQKVRTTKM